MFHTGKSVHVGAVHVEQRALGVQDFGNLRNAIFKDAQRGGIRDHQSGHVGSHQFAQFVDVDLSVRFGLDVFHFVAGNHRRGRIRAVSGVRN